MLVSPVWKYCLGTNIQESYTLCINQTLGTVDKILLKQMNFIVDKYVVSVVSLL